jgi:murein L,D-transpeptidase YcbB/YkuD
MVGRKVSWLMLRHKYEGFSEKFKAPCHMSRIFTVMPVCLILMPWQASLAIEQVPPEVIRAETVADGSTVLQDPAYQRLRSALQQYRALAADGGWPEVPGGPTIRPASDDPRLTTLARRLSISGDLADHQTWVESSGYDTVLQTAVRRFQARHGLEVDGLVGQATLRALNVPVEQRIDQIRVNLERARRRFYAGAEDFILVNIAGFKAYVVRDGKTVWTTKVIVGDPEHKTPVFSAALRYVVVNPEWTVPYKIASEELLPEIKQDPDFFTKGNYQLFDVDGGVVDPISVDWNSIRTGDFPFTLVQRPCSANQLGRIKFIFPNEYSVYMHDTPGKFLFTKAKRAFSHGCIRVDAPLGLAEAVLEGEGWSREQIESQIGSGETKTVILAEPLPVFIFYWTAEVDDQGLINFYDDIYERDATVLESLDR